MREFPQLNPGEFSVLMVDCATGHVLVESGKVSISETDEIYKVFASLAAARDYILCKQKENGRWEFTLQDHTEALVAQVRPT